MLAVVRPRGQLTAQYQPGLSSRWPPPPARGVPTPVQGCLCGSHDESTTRAQADFVATLPDGGGGETFLYFGGRWEQSPYGTNGARAAVRDPARVFRRRQRCARDVAGLGRV